MNTKGKAATKTTETNDREFIEIKSHEIKNVRVIATKNGDLVLFTLVINGVTIYNCRVATGKNGDFIAFEQYKGSDGKYYNHAFAPISNDNQKILLAEIQEAVDKL